jgi:hypothetical protein
MVDYKFPLCDFVKQKSHHNKEETIFQGEEKKKNIRNQEWDNGLEAVAHAYNPSYT